jgi:hypothetical protein
MPVGEFADIRLSARWLKERSQQKVIADRVMGFGDNPPAAEGHNMRTFSTVFGIQAMRMVVWEKKTGAAKEVLLYALYWLCTCTAEIRLESVLTERQN